MIKTLATFIFMVLSATICLAENVINIEQKDGSATRFVFETDVEMIYSGNNLIITSSNEQAIFELSTLRKATFQVESSLIEKNLTEQATFFFKNNTITVKNARPNTLMQILSIDGSRIGTWRTDSQGWLSVDMNNLKTNIYIIALDGITYKIAKL